MERSKSRHDYAHCYKFKPSEAYSYYIPSSNIQDFSIDSLKRIKQHDEDIKTIFASEEDIKALIAEGSIPFLEYYLDNGFDIFMNIRNVELAHLKYIIETNNLILMQFVIEYYKNTPMNIKHCNSLMDYAVTRCRLSFVKLFINIGMYFNANKLLNVLNARIKVTHGLTYKSGNAPESIHDYIIPHTTDVAHKCTLYERYDNAVIEESFKSKYISRPEVEKDIVPPNSEDCAKTHVFLMTMAAKTPDEKTLPLELYPSLTKASLKIYVKAGLMPTDFTQMVKMIEHEELYKLVIPYTRIEHTRVYHTFIARICEKLSYLRALTVRPDAVHIIKNCCESIAIIHGKQHFDENSMDLIEFYYRYVPHIVHKIIKPTDAMVEWAADKSIDMYNFITLQHQTRSVCVVYSIYDHNINKQRTEYISPQTIDQIVRFDLLSKKISVFSDPYEYKENKLLQANNRFQNIFHTDDKFAYYRHSLCGWVISSCIKQNYYKHFEYLLQFIPGGMTLENATMFVGKNEHIPDELKVFVDNASMTKPARSKKE